MLLDIITCLFVAFGFYQGFSQGLVKTIFATLSLIVGIIAALKLSPIVIDALQNAINLSPAIVFVIGFVATFIIVLILIRFIGGRITKLLEAINIGGLDKLAGGFVLSLFYSILISYGVFFVDKIELLSEEVKSQSFTYPMLEPLPRITSDVGRSLKPVFSEFWDQLLTTMDAIKEKGEQVVPSKKE